MIPKSYISIQVTKSVKLPNDHKLSQNAKQQFKNSSLSIKEKYPENNLLQWEYFPNII